ncbi:MAG: uridine kinase [Nitrospinae bacterium]|nr:uridine kinase [Nitrospinota bacterium]
MDASFTGNPRKTFIVGISGGSAAGKTMVANLLAEMMADISPLVIGVDRYFLDRSSLSAEERARINYDEPEALNFSLLAEDLATLRRGEGIAMPIYDYANHAAIQNAEPVPHARLVIVEGILLFHPAAIQPLLDFRLFVDADRDVRLKRRIARDTLERGRCEQSVIRQFNDTVEPGFEKYILPTRAESDFILVWNIKDMRSLTRAAEIIRGRMV